MRTTFKTLARKLAYLWKTYGISFSTWMDLYEEQDYSCAICGTHQDDLDYDLYVDHDHDTEEVRGLLCASCNSGLGFFHDDEELLQNAIDYLDETPFERTRSTIIGG